MIRLFIQTALCIVSSVGGMALIAVGILFAGHGRLGHALFLTACGIILSGIAVLTITVIAHQLTTPTHP